jgi:type I restriction enzyme R subunit
VQIELKTLGVNPRRAMEQIVEYKNDPGNGYTKTLLCFMQLFIVSNRDRTYYFANNNARHFAFNADERFLPVYEFADEANTKITHLDQFAESFLKKCDLARTISRYMVLLAGEQKLMIMRPYQVYAVQHMVKCIDEDNGNGFIWHTTGSGKTLTSFKASTLLKENEHIHKCVFVVDRKDLDRQTREEFNKLPGRLRRGEHQHRRPRPPPALRGLCRQGDRHHHPEARPRAWMRPASGTSSGRRTTSRPRRSCSPR